MTSPLDPTYAIARDRFRRTAERAGADVTATIHPEHGLEGEELAVDVAQLGPTDASVGLVVLSGTHGVEGYCGSALQRRLLDRHSDGTAPLPTDMQVLLVHALNPYGFSWVRRTNENNVDLNRNFVDWAEPPPTNTAYDSVAELVVPTDSSTDALDAAGASLFEWLTEVGMEAAQQALSGGQYAWPTGVFYGGTSPEWSNTWLRGFLTERLATVERLVVVDLHTGLGPNGHGELITSYTTESESYQRATDCWGEVTSMVDGQSVSAQLSGDWLNTVDDLLPDTTVTAAALEFGTVDPLTVFVALRADAWLHAHSAPDGPIDPHGPLAERTRADVRAAFAEDTTEWFDQVSARFDQVVSQSLTHLVADDR